MAIFIYRKENRNETERNGVRLNENNAPTKKNCAEFCIIIETQIISNSILRFGRECAGFLLFPVRSTWAALAVRWPNRLPRNLSFKYSRMAERRAERKATTEIGNDYYWCKIFMLELPMFALSLRRFRSDRAEKGAPICRAARPATELMKQKPKSRKNSSCWIQICCNKAAQCAISNSVANSPFMQIAFFYINKIYAVINWLENCFEPLNTNYVLCHTCNSFISTRNQAIFLVALELARISTTLAESLLSK